MQSFKALHHLTCQGKEYEPGDILPGATSFPNLKEMIEWRYIGYASAEEVAAYEAKQAELAELEKQAKQLEEETKQAELAEQQKQEKLSKKQQKQADVVVIAEATTTEEALSEVEQQVAQEEAPK